MSASIPISARGSRFWQTVCDTTVPGAERERLGGWWLRGDLGETGRANSAWPAGDPGCGIAEALERTQRWYLDRGLAPMVQLYTSTDPAVTEELDRRRWLVVRGADVLAVDLAAAVAAVAARSDETVVLAPEPSAAFLELTANQNRVAEMRRTADRRWFASVVAPMGQALGCGLAIRAEASIGIFAMMTAPFARGRGIARQVLAALLQAGLADGAEVAFLQVMTQNAAAQALYRSAGFRPVEHYEYRMPLDKDSEKRHSW